MDQIISNCVAKRAFRHGLVVLWIVAGLVTVAAPGATQETRLATLSLCKLDLPLRDTMNVKYRATVLWTDSNRVNNTYVTFYIGALNPNDELWPQVSSRQILRNREGHVRTAKIEFVVSRRSMFPTRFAVYGLEQGAENTRANACSSSSTCYLQLPIDEVHLVSNEIPIETFRQGRDMAPCRD